MFNCSHIVVISFIEHSVKFWLDRASKSKIHLVINDNEINQLKDVLLTANYVALVEIGLKMCGK